MKKIKLITSLTSLGLVATATPIIATSCSKKETDVTLVNGMSRNQNNALALATFAGFSGYNAGSAKLNAEPTDPDMQVLNNLIPTINGFFTNKTVDTYEIEENTDPDYSTYKYKEVISFNIAAGQKDEFTLWYNATTKVVEDDNDDEEITYLTIIKGKAKSNTVDSTDIFDVEGTFEREVEDGKEIEVEDTSTLTFTNTTAGKTDEWFKVVQEAETEEGENEVEFAYRDNTGSKYSYECELEGMDEEIEFKNGDSTTSTKYWIARSNSGKTFTAYKEKTMTTKAGIWNYTDGKWEYEDPK